MSVSVELDGVKKKIKVDAAKRRLLASHILEDCDKYVPVDTGNLHDNRKVNNDGTELEWSEEYAKVNYYRDESTDWTNPNRLGTNPHPAWVEFAKGRHIKEWCQFLAKQVTS